MKFVKPNAKHIELFVLPNAPALIPYRHWCFHLIRPIRSVRWAIRTNEKWMRFFRLKSIGIEKSKLAMGEPTNDQMERAEISPKKGKKNIC